MKMILTDVQKGILRRSVDGISAKCLTSSEQEAFSWLLSNHLLGYAELSDTTARITQYGLSVLQSMDEETAQHTKNERQQRFDNKISILNVLIPLITFIVGLIVERYSGIIERLFPR